MDYPVRLPLYISWKDLKRIIGWPYSRAQTGRLMHDPDYVDRRFPASRKLGSHRNNHPIWYTPDVLDYFRRHGLTVPENVEFS
ncbi:MAG: hypothetical protein E6Q97_08455 [Desulfurellales bacterium]|nr:MAG: hypothetical protein E6Q97_08455 [Desulfurellales bacterium]